jgi:cytoskeletal protein CcmA (bactofilin family)
MFKKSEPESVRTEPTNRLVERQSPSTKPKETATVGPSIQIRGDLAGDEDLVVQGRVEGTITLKQNLVTIGQEGEVNATVNARVVVVEGKVEGDLNGEEQVVLKNSANVRGNIAAPRITVEDGAHFKGSIDMESQAPRKSDGDVTTNKVTEIKSPAAPGDVTSKKPAGKSGDQQLFKS